MLSISANDNSHRRVRRTVVFVGGAALALGGATVLLDRREPPPPAAVPAAEPAPPAPPPTGAPPSTTPAPTEVAPLDVALTTIERPPHGRFLEYRIDAPPPDATRIAVRVDGVTIAEDSPVPGGQFGINVADLPANAAIEVVAIDRLGTPIASSGARPMRLTAG